MPVQKFRFATAHSRGVSLTFQRLERPPGGPTVCGVTSTDQCSQRSVTDEPRTPGSRQRSHEVIRGHLRSPRITAWSLAGCPSQKSVIECHQEFTECHRVSPPQVSAGAGGAGSVFDTASVVRAVGATQPLVLSHTHIAWPAVFEEGSATLSRIVSLPDRWQKWSQRPANRLLSGIHD